MTDELNEELIEFNREALQAWCFLHIVNLVGKTMVKAFDIHIKMPLRWIMTCKVLMPEGLMQRIGRQSQKMIVILLIMITWMVELTRLHPWPTINMLI